MDGFDLKVVLYNIGILNDGMRVIDGGGRARRFLRKIRGFL